MIAPGSGNPPTIYNLQASCSVSPTTGESVVSFLVNKGKAGAVCTMFIYESGDPDRAAVWYGDDIPANQTVKSYAVTPGLANGRYVINANNGDAETEANLLVDCAPAGGSTPPDPLVLDFATPTGATQNAGGSLRVQATGGTPPLTAELTTTATSQAAASGQPTDFLNLPAGSYQGRIYDSASPRQQVSFSATVGAYVPAVVMGCIDPAADNYDPAATQDDGSCTYPVVVRTAYFEVPPMQSLRFVQPLRLDRPAFDNTLLADETPLDYENPGYCQKVNQTDRLVVQVLSSYLRVPTLSLEPADGSTSPLPLLFTRVQQGAGETAELPVYLKADATAGRTRVYFNADALPLPFKPGDRVTISSTGTALDGTYPVQQVLEDASAGVPYLLLLVAYPGGSFRLDGSLTTTYKVQAFDTYQLAVDFAAVPPGCYQARITATDPDFDDALAVSEPVEVGSHPDTLLITYRNFDNAFGLNYSHGLVNRLRVVGRLLKGPPTTEKSVFLNNNGERELLQAAAYRQAPLEVLQIPAWLNEVLAVAFCHDYTTVEGVRGTVTGECTYKPTDRYTLGTTTALLEVKPFLGAGNSDDLGDPDAGGPFLLADNNFLLARR